MLNRLTVFACESQPIVLEGLAKVLSDCHDLEFVGSASTLSDALEALRQRHPDVLLVDQTPGLKVVFQFISDAKSTSPRCQPVLWVNDLAEIDCFRALQLGARGILKKTLPIPSVIECLRSVGRGNVWIESSLSEHMGGSLDRRSTPRLTPREKEIVHHVCGGMKNKEIAEALTITPGTVKVHLMHIFEKTGVKDRFELAVHGRRLLGVEHAEAIARAESVAIGADES
ncbi:MAG TPA: response regulator transcription factor [Bryobacteraceae bacterium]|nr:response regulator transcription factor [Bryobacteraceae bacterium]